MTSPSLHPLQEEWDADLRGADPLSFPGYADRLEVIPHEAVRTGRSEHYAVIEGRFDVMGGSLGAAAGERVVRAYRRAVDLRLPVVVLAASGGARMQEGMVALIQMARTVEAATSHAQAGLLSLAVLRSPTTGGTYASYASLCDLRAAHAGATVGFAGPRVVADLLGEMPEGSHTAEFAYRHGLVDAIVDETDETAWIESALGLRSAPLEARELPAEKGPSPSPGPSSPDGAWAEVVAARRPGRPSGIDRAAALCSSWTELRGTDPVVRAGLTTLAERRVVVVATDRYAMSPVATGAGDVGRPGPDAYRLAERAMALAGRLGLPLVTLVDTPGAHPGSEAEAGGIAGEIARTVAAMAAVPTPSVSVCVGEGGSGGALALAYADRLLVQEHAVFSVIAPEGAASILERDPDKAPELADRLGLTSAELHRLGVVDEVVPEDPIGLAEAVAAALDQAVPGERKRRFDAATERWLR